MPNFKLIKDSKMTKDKQSQNNNSTDTNTETEFRNSSNSKLESPQTGVWKFLQDVNLKLMVNGKGSCDYCRTFYLCAKPQDLWAHLANLCKKVSEELQRHFNYIIHRFNKYIKDTYRDPFIIPISIYYVSTFNLVCYSFLADVW